jgi:hypothetical protein
MLQQEGLLVGCASLKGKVVADQGLEPRTQGL